MTGKRILWSLLGLSLILQPAAASLGQAAAKPASAVRKAAPVQLTAIKVQFKVEEITPANFYMGEVWVWPTRFNGIQIGKKFTVPARAWGMDALGLAYKIEPTWTTSDRSFMVVSPNQGQRVKLTVLKAGQGEMLLTSGDLTKRLKVKAEYLDDRIQVEISQ